MRGILGFSLANKYARLRQEELAALDGSGADEPGFAPPSNAGRLKWATTSSKSPGLRNAVDRLARLDNGTHSETDSGSGNHQSLGGPDHAFVGGYLVVEGAEQLADPPALPRFDASRTKTSRRIP